MLGNVISMMRRSIKKFSPKESKNIKEFESTWLWDVKTLWNSYVWIAFVDS